MSEIDQDAVEESTDNSSTSASAMNCAVSTANRTTNNANCMFSCSQLEEFWNLQAQSIPRGVIWVMLVGFLMAIWSFLLVSLPPPLIHEGLELGKHNALRWVVTTDCFAIQNLGHSAFLIMFATSWWRNYNVLGLCMCEISCIFLAFCSFGYCVLVAWFWEQATAAHVGVPALFTIVLIIASRQVTLMARDHKLSILRLKLYLIRDPDTLLRRILFANCAYTSLEPLIVSISRVLLYGNHTFLEESIAFPALSLRGFIESYTLGFHLAFVAATAFAVVIVDDLQKDIGAIWLAFFGETALAVAFGVGALYIPSDPLFSSMLWFKIAQHLCISVLLLRLIFRITQSRRVMANQPEISKEADDKNEPMELSLNRSFTGFTLLSVLNVANTSRDKAVAIACLVSVVFHGLMWQVQSILVVWLSAISPEIMDRVNGLRSGLNFSLHGSGITVYLCVLALRSPISFPMFQAAGVLGSIGGAFMSIIQLQVVGEGESYEHHITFWFFVLRMIAGLAMGISYFYLKYPEYSSLEDSIKNIDVSDGIEDGNSNPSIEEKHDSSFGWGFRRGLTFVLIFVAVVVIYSCVVAYQLGHAGVRAGFWFNSNSNATEVAKLDAWHEHRLVEFPPGFGLVYHFAFLMPGFTLHYYAQEFLPSKWIGVGFATGTVIVFLAQAVLCYLGIVEYANNSFTSAVFWASFGSAAAGIFVIVDLFRFSPKGDHSTVKLSADFWQ